MHCSDCLNSRPRLLGIDHEQYNLVNEHPKLLGETHNSSHTGASCKLPSRRRIERNLLVEGPTQPQRHESNLVATPD